MGPFSAAAKYVLLMFMAVSTPRPPCPDNKSDVRSVKDGNISVVTAAGCRFQEG